MNRPTPITAYSLCNALGANRADVLAGLAKGETALGPSPIPVPFPTAVGRLPGELPELTGELAPWSTRMARIAALLVEPLDAALTKARARWPAERIAVVLGTSTAGAEHTEQAYKHFVESGALPADYDFRRQHTYGAILHVMRMLTGAAGPAWMVSTACTSSAKPLASARRMIAAGQVDAVIAGGFDTLCMMTLCGFFSLGALSATPCRPFHAERDGISIGEGGALLLLERDGEAVALLEGVGEGSDAYHISAPHPEGHGAEAAMRAALADGGVGPEDIDLVNAHGTGTRLNDLAEGAAIGRLLGDAVPVVSTKAYTGHTLGGAGATEAAMALLALEEGWVPATPGAAPLDERLAIHVATERIEGRFHRALSNSFAFGGNNISVLLRSA